MPPETLRVRSEREEDQFTQAGRPAATWSIPPAGVPPARVRLSFFFFFRAVSFPSAGGRACMVISRHRLRTGSWLNGPGIGAKSSAMQRAGEQGTRASYVLEVVDFVPPVRSRVLYTFVLEHVFSPTYMR
jgi:hypothetical protein